MADRPALAVRRRRRRRIAAAILALGAVYVTCSAVLVLWFSSGMARFDGESLSGTDFLVYGVVPLGIAVLLAVVTVRLWRGRRVLPTFR